MSLPTTYFPNWLDVSFISPSLRIPVQCCFRCSHIADWYSHGWLGSGRSSFIRELSIYNFDPSETDISLTIDHNGMFE